MDGGAAFEVWTASAGIPHFTARVAAQAESEGWDGLGLVDSQNLAGDPFVELALAAATTTTLQLATAVTNPFTRHAAALATVAATVHEESDGRMVLGIGRGDSALAHLGLAPASVGEFDRYLERLQGYLAGTEVPFSDADRDTVAPSSALGMAAGPEASRLRWLAFTRQPKLAVDVAATGPKVIGVAASRADRITFAVGASAERVRWAIETARAAAAAAGRDPSTIPFGVYVPVFVDDDRDRARQMIAGGVASFARFSVMHGQVQGPTDAATADVLHEVHDRYDMDHHFMHGSPQSAPLTDEVIDAFGIAGPAPYCVDRILELRALGLGKLFVLAGGVNLDRETARGAHDRFVADVLPRIRP
jgi:5,10-methylenetetrahydromethanopterin reductase